MMDDQTERLETAKIVFQFQKMMFDLKDKVCASEMTTKQAGDIALERGCAILSHHDELMKKKVRKALADYIQSEGCSCCRGDDHEKHAEKLAKLLQVEEYSDKSDYNFNKYATEPTRFEGDEVEEREIKDLEG